MKRPLLVILAVACNSGAPEPSRAGPDGGPGVQAAGAPRPVRGLRKARRWQAVAVPVAFAHDGVGWIGADDRALVRHDGRRELGRWPVMVAGVGARLAPLPGGGWLAGTSILDREGTVQFDGYGWAQRYGRFGSPKAMAVSPDGRVAIVDGADSPSTCLCDRERGTSGSSAGALVRLAFVEGRVVERVLIEHRGSRFHVAASPTAVAALEGATLRVWPAAGDGPATLATIPGATLGSLAWAGERYLVATRYVELDRTDVVLLDRDAGFQPVATWPVAGMVRDLAIRPGAAELAVATTRYRATDVVHVDERRVWVHALDGTLRARVDTVGYPSSIAWSPRGDALLVATVGAGRDQAEVTRYDVR